MNAVQAVISMILQGSEKVFAKKKKQKKKEAMRSEID